MWQALVPKYKLSVSVLDRVLLYIPGLHGVLYIDKLPSSVSQVQGLNVCHHVQHPTYFKSIFRAGSL